MFYKYSSPKLIAQEIINRKKEVRDAYVEEGIPQGAREYLDNLNRRTREKMNENTGLNEFYKCFNDLISEIADGNSTLEFQESQKTIKSIQNINNKHYFHSIISALFEHLTGIIGIIIAGIIYGISNNIKIGALATLIRLIVYEHVRNNYYVLKKIKYQQIVPLAIMIVGILLDIYGLSSIGNILIGTCIISVVSRQKAKYERIKSITSILGDMSIFNDAYRQKIIYIVKNHNTLGRQVLSWHQDK